MWRQKKLIIILAFIIGILFAFSRLRQQEQPIKIISVLPPQDALNVDLNFSPQVELEQSGKTLSLISQPEIDALLQTEEQKAIFALNQPLKPQTKYNLSLLVEGKIVYSWSFTTRNQTEDELVKEEEAISLQAYPLAEKLPYETEEFRIDYEGPLYLLITIKKGGADSIKRKASDWILSQGVDPSTHQFKWLTLEL